MKFVSFLHWSFLFIFLFAKWPTKETSARGLAGQRAVSTVVPEDWDIVSALASVMKTVKDKPTKPRQGADKKSATERPLIYVCKGKNAAYVTKNELLFCDTELFSIEEMCG